jgi:hypothetical protein
MGPAGQLLADQLGIECSFAVDEAIVVTMAVGLCGL